MLIFIDQLDEINRSLYQTFGRIGLDLSNGNYLSVASAPGKGQNGMYILHVHNKMLPVIWAGSDQGAIDEADYRK